MPELIVMRHAKSEWGTGLPDFDRPLAERGHRDAPRMAQWLEDEGLGPDAILASSAIRAQTTARYVADHFSLADSVVDERADLYLAGPSTWVNALHRLPDRPRRLLICGHNPGLDELVDHLASEEPELSDSGKLMTTAAIAVFSVEDWSSLSPETVRLEQIKRPRELS